LRLSRSRLARRLGALGILPGWRRTCGADRFGLAPDRRTGPPQLKHSYFTPVSDMPFPGSFGVLSVQPSAGRLHPLAVCQNKALRRVGSPDCGPASGPTIPRCGNRILQNHPAMPPLRPWDPLWRHSGPCSFLPAGAGSGGAARRRKPPPDPRRRRGSRFPERSAGASSNGIQLRAEGARNARGRLRPVAPRAEFLAQPEEVARPLRLPRFRIVRSTFTRVALGLPFAQAGGARASTRRRCSPGTRTLGKADAGARLGRVSSQGLPLTCNASGLRSREPD
jgi:hypothetical protein